jgi:hypothetical protein
MSLRTGLIVVMLLIGACGGDSEGDSIAGTYNCAREGQPTEGVVELREDGTLTITPEGPFPVEEGTWSWSVEGEQGAFHLGEGDDPFTIEGDNLVFADPDAAVRFVCTPAD